MITTLAVCQAVAEEVGYRLPTSVFSGVPENREQARKLKRGLVRCCRFLHRYADWNALTEVVTFTSGAPGVQVDIWPSTAARMVRGSGYSLTHEMDVAGPLTPLTYATYLDSPERRAGLAVQGGALLYTAPQGAGERLRVAYVRSDYVIASDDTRKTAITADDDKLPWPAELLELGTIWAVLHRDGDAENEDYQAFVGALNEHRTIEADGDVLDMSGGQTVTGGRWPATGWGLE